MYFSVVMSIVKYLYRLENISDRLLKEAYVLAKDLHYKGIQTWYTLAVFILQLLNLNISSCRNLGETQLVNIVKATLITGFKSFWQQQRGRKILDGKLDTYFSVKYDFYKEPYLNLENFHLRKVICKLRITAHNLLIETGRFSKSRILPREERICRFCNLNAIENEFHFLTQCSLYNNERVKLFEKIRNFNCNFVLLNDIDKAIWLLLQENLDILLALGSFIHNCFEIGNNKRT